MVVNLLRTISHCVLRRRIFGAEFTTIVSVWFGAEDVCIPAADLPEDPALGQFSQCRNLGVGEPVCLQGTGSSEQSISASASAQN